MSENAIGDIHRRVDSHEREIGLLRGDLAGLGREVHNVRETQSEQNKKLDQIMQAVATSTATMQAHKPVNSIDAIRHGLSIVKDLAILLSLVGGVIIFLATSVFNNNDSTKTELAVMQERLSHAGQPSVDTARLEERLKYLENVTPWRPSIVTGSAK